MSWSELARYIIAGGPGRSWVCAFLLDFDRLLFVGPEAGAQMTVTGDLHLREDSGKSQVDVAKAKDVS